MTWCSTTGASALKRVIRGWRAALRAWAFSAALLACGPTAAVARSEEHTSELQSQSNLVCRLLLEKKKNTADLWYARCSHLRSLRCSLLNLVEPLSGGPHIVSDFLTAYTLLTINNTGTRSIHVLY